MKRSNIITLVLTTVMIVCSYVHIFYSHRLSKLDGLDQLAIALSIFFSIQIWSSKNYLIKGLTFVLIAGSTLLLLNILHNNYADSQLDKHGTNTNAVVTSVEYKSGYKSYPGIIIRFTYTSGGRTYTHSIMDDIDVERRFLVGDTLSIKYSSIDPDLFEEVEN